MRLPTFYEQNLIPNWGMYIDFFLMTLFGGIYNIYTSKNYYIYLYK